MESIGLWSARLKAGQVLTLIPGATLTITNAALGLVIEDKVARCNLKLTYTPSGMDKKVYTDLGSLIPGKVEALQLALPLERGQVYEFEAQGLNNFAITGHFEVDYDDDGDPIPPVPTEVSYSTDAPPPVKQGKRVKAAPMEGEKPIKIEKSGEPKKGQLPSSKTLGKRKASEAATATSKASTAASATSDDDEDYEDLPAPKKSKGAKGVARKK